MEELTNFFSPQLIWFMIGLAFILLEFLVPGVIIIFFGVGAWVTSLLLLLFNFGINTQLVIFLVSSIVLLVVLRKKVKNIFVGKSEVDAEAENEEFIGKKVKVVSAISLLEGGKVLFNGTNWSAEADVDVAENSMVEIIGKNNLTLKVKPLGSVKS